MRRIIIVCSIILGLGFLGFILYSGIQALREATNLGRAFSASYKFAQSQEKAGRDYMNGMTNADFNEILECSKKLMAEPPSPDHRWRALSEFDTRDVPQEWKNRKIIFIRYRPNKVWFGWHGGANAHTHLLVEKSPSGVFTFTAHYSDNEPEKILKTIPEKQDSLSLPLNPK